LGGDSLQAVRLITLLEIHFACVITLTELWRAPTLSRMAAILEENGSLGWILGDGEAVVPLQAGGSRIPFFCFPGADENPYYFSHLVQSLGPEQPFYVLRDPRPLEDRGVYTVEEAAGRFIEYLKSVQSEGPYIVGGHCYGGIVAFELARQLVARGDHVGLIVLFEVPAPGYPKVVRNWKTYGRQAVSLLRRDRRSALAEASAHFRVLRTLFRRKAIMLTRRALFGMGLKGIVEPLERSKHPNTQAGLSYDPRSVTCDVIQFIAAAEWHSTRILADPRFAWQEFTRGQFTICQTPGKANAIFKPPHARDMAARLDEALASVNDELDKKGDVGRISPPLLSAK
jgi:thioesterase domain-containing protein